MIIGAFSIGLALSGTDLAHRLEEPLRGVYAALIPIFFVVMGMLVDVTALGGVWQFGIAATALAIIGKVVGSGVPALFTGFNLFGAWRIGIGMLPRGEVALIMAGIGVGAGLIRQELFGVAIIVTVVTTVAGAAGARALLPGGGLRTPVAGGYRGIRGKETRWLTRTKRSYRRLRGSCFRTPSSVT